MSVANQLEHLITSWLVAFKTNNMSDMIPKTQVLLNSPWMKGIKNKNTILLNMHNSQIQLAKLKNVSGKALLMDKIITTLNQNKQHPYTFLSTHADDNNGQ